jgi:hypothetical protein
MTACTAEDSRNRLAEESDPTRPDRAVVKRFTHDVFLNVCVGSSAGDRWPHDRNDSP